MFLYFDDEMKLKRRIRAKKHVMPESKIKTGWLVRYQRNVTASCRGAVME